MKILRLFATLSLFFIAGMASAQDVIVKKDQSTVISKVLEITNTEIKYKKWNNQDGPTYSIDRSEVLSINYENGEVEKFTETTNNQQNTNVPNIQYLNSYMTKTSGRLYLNGRQLSDYEIRRLVGPDSYQQYQKGRKLGQAGIILDVIGGVSLLVGVGMKLFNSDLNTTGTSVIGTPAFKTHLTISAIGVASLSTGILLGLFGIENMDKVAETYNKNHGNTYSLNISPSMMRCEIPQSQGNCGLGLTLSMNF